jgi:hypothetical protein
MGLPKVGFDPGWPLRLDPCLFLIAVPGPSPRGSTRARSTTASDSRREQETGTVRRATDRSDVLPAPRQEGVADRRVGLFHQRRPERGVLVGEQALLKAAGEALAVRVWVNHGLGDREDVTGRRELFDAPRNGPVEPPPPRPLAPYGESVDTPTEAVLSAISRAKPGRRMAPVSRRRNSAKHRMSEMCTRYSMKAGRHTLTCDRPGRATPVCIRRGRWSTADAAARSTA